MRERERLRYFEPKLVLKPMPKMMLKAGIGWLGTIV